MIATWPPSLPKPVRSAYQARSDDPRRLRRTEAGPPSLGRRYSTVARRMQLAIKITRGERDVFYDFHDRLLRHGTLPFLMPDPVTDGWPIVAPDGAPLLTPQGAPLLSARTILCQMGDETPLEGPLEGRTFTIAFAVMVLP